jgi:hypothetical protein
MCANDPFVQVMSKLFLLLRFLQLGKRCSFLFLVQAPESCFCGGGDTTMDQICWGPIVSLPVKDFIKCHLAGGMVLLSQVFSLQIFNHLCVMPGYVTVILQLMVLFVGSWFSVGCSAYTCCACLEVVFEFEFRATYFCSLRTKVISTPLSMSKWVGPLMNWCRMFLAQPPHLPPNMHQKLIKRQRCCMQINQLLTKSLLS